MNLGTRIRSWSSTNRPWFQQMAVTASAVGAAWVIAEAFGASSLLASILTVITLRRSLHASLTEGFSQILGTAAGVGVALGSTMLFGKNVITVVLTIATAIVVARVMRLGDDGAIGVCVTALVVMGPGLPETAAHERLAGTMIGVTVALIFSYWANPSTPVGRAQSLINDLTRKTADILSTMAEGVVDGYTAAEAATWLVRARELSVSTEQARFQVEEALRYSRWYPTASREEADGVFARFVGVEHSVVQVRTIARSYFDAETKGVRLDDDVTTAVAQAMELAGEALLLSGELTSENPTAAIDDQVLEEMREQSAEVLSMLPAQEVSGDELLLGASIVSNLERITDSLDVSGAAIAEVDTPLVTNSPVDAVVDAFKSPLRRIRRVRAEE